MSKEKKLFIAATRQNDGKTLVSLGLIQAFKQYSENIGFMKPVGQRYVEIEGYEVDEDAVLIKSCCNCDGELQHISPIAVERGFTEEYIDHGKKQVLVNIIKESYKEVSKGKDLVVIEGTGHAGVGSVFDLGNGSVAKLLGAKVLIITVGGIGRPIDEIVLNKALFEKEGVELVGVVINKVIPDKMDKIKDYIKRGLAKKGIELFGAIPYTKRLTWPNIKQVMESIPSKLINGRESLDNQIEKIVVGAMTPHNALGFFGERVLLITPADREDIVLAAMSSSVIGTERKHGISGIILTGKMQIHQSVMNLIQKTTIPVLAVDIDTYGVASLIHDLVVKIAETDMEKIKTAKSLVEEYVDVERLFERLSRNN